MEDMPDESARAYPKMSRDFLCEQHNKGLNENTKTIGVLAETIKYGFKAGEEKMVQLGDKINKNHEEIKEKMELHGGRLDTLEKDVWLTRKAKIWFYWIGGFSGLAAAVLWIAGPLKALARAIVTP
jgi:hypothetical protein